MKKYYIINQKIKGDEFRVIDASAGQIGILSREEVFKLAKKDELDVVLVAEKAKPPVVKLVNFTKYKYEQQQKNKSGKKKTKTVGIKEIRFTPFIAKGDYDTRMNKARDFLEDGNKVKLNVKFTGRQITRKDFGKNLLEKAIDELSDLATVEREPNLVGKIYSTQLQPKN